MWTISDCIEWCDQNISVAMRWHRWKQQITVPILAMVGRPLRPHIRLSLVIEPTLSRMPFSFVSFYFREYIKSTWIMQMLRFGTICLGRDNEALCVHFSMCIIPVRMI